MVETKSPAVIQTVWFGGSRGNEEQRTLWGSGGLMVWSCCLVGRMPRFCRSVPLPSEPHSNELWARNGIFFIHSFSALCPHFLQTCFCLQNFIKDDCTARCPHIRIWSSLEIAGLLSGFMVKCDSSSRSYNSSEDPPRVL